MPFDFYIQQFKVFFKSTREEVLYILVGAILGYTVHKTAALYVKHTSKKPNLSPENQTRKYRRFIRLITRFRGGEIATVAVASFIKTVIETCAVDVAATTITGIAGAVLTYISKNTIILYEASIAGITDAALRPVYAGVISGLGVLTITCKDIPATVDAMTSLDVSYTNAENQLNSLLDRLELLSHEDKVYFAICLVTLLVYLYMTPGLHDRYYMLLEKLRELLRRKKISKYLYRLILRKLIRLNVPVDRIEYTSLIDEVDKTMDVMESAPIVTFHLFSNKLPVGI
jgi:hypothetical protein